MPGFHHDFSPMSEFTPDVGFRTYSDPQVVPPLISSLLESEDFVVSTPNPASMAAVQDAQLHGDVPTGLQPPPGQPPPFLFLGGDPGRMLRAARDFSTRPPPDQTTPASTEDTSQDDDVTVSPAGNQSVVLARVATPSARLVPLSSPRPGI